MKQPETCEISQTAAGGKVDELAMLVRQLVHSLRRASPSNDLADRALDYLKRHGLAGTVLRGNSAFIPDDVPAGMKPSMASDAVGTSGGACRSESVPALQEALREAKCAINSMKAEAETAAQGDEQMMLEACEQISNEGLEASLAIDAVLGTWDMHQIQEPASVQAVQPVICDTCNDHGMIGGPSFYDPGEGGQPCPDCEERHRNSLAAGDLMAWGAEVGGNRIAENVVEMTREDLQRLIAERTPQTAPAAVAVPDERAAFEKWWREWGLGGIDVQWEAWQARAALAATPAAAPLPLLVRDIARELGITCAEACLALKPLGNFSTNTAVTAEMMAKLRECFPELVPASEVAGARERMTAGRACYFMERFLKEEKLLGPNEQAALHYVIDMLEAAAAPVVLPEPDTGVAEGLAKIEVYAKFISDRMDHKEWFDGTFPGLPNALIYESGERALFILNVVREMRALLATATGLPAQACIATLTVDSCGNVDYETAQAGWLMPEGVYPLYSAPLALTAHRDAAFEAVRQKFCKLQRYSFFLDDKGNVRRTPDYCGNWVEFEAVHTLFEPAAVDAAIAAQTIQQGGS